jgi:elongation factor 1-gamma
MLETEHGTLVESAAIARYLGRLGGSGLSGNDAWETAQIDQFIDLAKSSINGHTYTIARSIFGWTPVETETFNNAIKDLKSVIITLNAHLQGRENLVGGRTTVADLVVAFSLSLPFQTVLDAGFRKSVAPNVAAWLERTLALPEVVGRIGHTKLAAKAMKPIAPPKKEEKKEEKKVVEAAPVMKKEVDPLDELPPSKLDFLAFKTYFVNLPDKKGEGMTHFFEKYDVEGYSLFYAKYEKAEGEGAVLYQFANLLNGFLQRLDDFRRHTFAMMAITGDEPALDIESVWMFRGKGIPARMVEHPQWEYYQVRELNVTNEADRQLISDFWCVKAEESINGKKVQMCKMHK